MTRAKTTWLSSIVLGLTFGGTVVADDDTNPAGPPVPPAEPVNSDTAAPTTDPTHTTTDATTDTTTTTVVTPAPTTDTTTTTVVTPAPSYETTIVATDADDYERERAGVTITAGAGAGGFTNQSLRNATDPGATWGVRLTFGTRSPLALEAAYIGSAQRINALGLDDNAYLVGNGVQAALRVNATLDLPVQPFLFAGLGWRRYDLANTVTATADVSDVDNVVEIPMGVGVAGKAAGLVIDVRGEYRPAFDEDLLPAIEDNNADAAASPMDRWGVNANIGYEF